MSRHEARLEDLWENPITNGYKQRVRQTEDRKRDSTTYILKTLKDRNGALKRYKI